jgi:hypothetical protein
MIRLRTTATWRDRVLTCVISDYRFCTQLVTPALIWLPMSLWQLRDDIPERGVLPRTDIIDAQRSKSDGAILHPKSLKGAIGISPRQSIHYGPGGLTSRIRTQGAGHRSVLERETAAISWH